MALMQRRLQAELDAGSFILVAVGFSETLTLSPGCFSCVGEAATTEQRSLWTSGGLRISAV